MDEISSFLLGVIESSSDAIVGLQLDGTVISWNSGAEHIYGFSREEMIGRSIARLSLPERADESLLLLSRLRRQEKLDHIQTTHLKKGGYPIPVSLSISAVVDVQNSVVGASFIARDLSSLYSFEKTLKETERRYRKLKSSMQLAHHIQATLLPAVTAISRDLDLFVKTEYSEAIGGDYYDFFAIHVPPDYMTGFAVGDVSGHGTGAALLMAMAKGVLQAESEHSPYDLVAIACRLNQFFCRLAEEGCLMTIFLALIDRRNLTLSWCSAGQGPVYLYHPHEQCFEELACTGPPLGVVRTPDYGCQSLKLRDGDVLILGTDGLWEARNRAGEMFSVERVRQLLATWHHKPAEEVCARILARVRRFTGRGELEDDTSLMVVKVPPRLQLKEGTL